MEKLDQILKDTNYIKSKIDKIENNESATTSGGTAEVETSNKNEDLEKEDKQNKDETHPKINLRLKKELKEKLDDLAAANGMHTATYVRTLCYMAITNAANLQLKDLNLKSELKKMEAEFV